MDMLLRRSRPAVMEHHAVLLPALFDALNADSDKVVQEALAVQARRGPVPWTLCPGPVYGSSGQAAPQATPASEEPVLNWEGEGRALSIRFAKF